MFDNARLKLTLWYLLIIMSISLTFSFFIFQLLQNEIRRLAIMQQQRLEHDSGQMFVIEEPGFAPRPAQLTFDQEVLADSRRRLLYVLLMVNGTILVLAGGLGYFLAGKTLKPIQEMVEGQRRFISDASHELRTPLTALKSTLEVNLRDQNLRLADAKTLISESIEEVNKLQKLSDDLLQLSHSQHATSTADFEVMETKKVILGAVQKVKPLAVVKKIKFKTELANLSIEAQPESIHQALVIILDNAIKYSPDKSVIRITSKKVGRSLHIAIADHGVGIAPKDLPHIFDRFYRTDSARSKTEVGGYGLGLSIAQQIIKTHRGRVKVESKPNQGTTFIFILPLVQKA